MTSASGSEPNPPGADDALRQLDDIYEHRFADDEAMRKDAIWGVICGFLQRYVDPDSAVLDIACDRGDFIKNISARERWACDVRDVSSHLPPRVRFVQVDGLSIADVLPLDHFDVAFMSNYLEHLSSGDDVLQQLRAVARVLRPGGLVIVLQPNIRLTREAYWDFIDHKVALTDKSLTEAAELSGFEVVHVIRRFLPYTTKGRLPVSPALVRLYLAVPAVWRIFGRQTLFVGRRS